MNAGSADTRLPHLDLGDLVAEITGQPISDQDREHLAGCEHCQLEANRWNLVADGVRGLAAAAAGAAQPASPRHTGHRLLQGSRRRAMLAGGVAAALVLAAIGYGVGTALSGHTPSPAGMTSLITITGCPRIGQAAGTLERVSAGSLVITTASGRPATVTTTATMSVVVSGAPLGDITNGKPVLVAGASSRGRIAADLVAVGGKISLAALPGIVQARGTISDASTAGFTVVTSAGTRVPVTTSSRTVVSVFSTHVGQLRLGATTIAFGYTGPHGRLSAIAVFQPIRLFQPPPPPGASHVSIHASTHAGMRVKNCSPATIDRVITALALGD